MQIHFRFPLARSAPLLLLLLFIFPFLKSCKNSTEVPARDPISPTPAPAAMAPVLTDRFPIIVQEDHALADGGMADLDPATGRYRVRLNPTHFTGDAAMLRFVIAHEKAHCRLGHIEELQAYGFPYCPAPGEDHVFDALRASQELAADAAAVADRLAADDRAAVIAAVAFFHARREHAWNSWYAKGLDRANQLQGLLMQEEAKRLSP